jgi:pentatricopeptide repeat protein
MLGMFKPLSRGVWQLSFSLKSSLYLSQSLFNSSQWRSYQQTVFKPSQKLIHEKNSIKQNKHKNRSVNKSPSSSSLAILSQEQELKEKIASGFQQPLQQDYSHLISLYRQQGSPQQAHRILIEMSEAGYTPSSASYNEVISAYVEVGLIQEAQSFLASMIDENLEVTVVSYGAVIKGLASSSSSPQQAEELLNQMTRRSELVPNLYCYNTVIDAYAKAGRPNDAQRIFDSLPIHSLQPDIVSYGALLSSYTSQPAHCEHILNTMPMDPNHVCYTSVITAYARAGQHEDVIRLLVKMREASVELNPATFNLLISSYTASGLMTAAERTISFMIESNVMPDLVNFTTVMTGYASIGQPERAEYLLQRLRKLSLSPNAVCYLTVIQAYVKSSQPREAERTLREMIDEGIEPTVKCYAAIMNGYSRASSPAEAQRIYEEMRERGIEANVVIFNTLINSYCRVAQPQEGEKILKELLLHLEQEEMEATIQQMASSSSPDFPPASSKRFKPSRLVRPDEISFASLIASYCKQNLIDDGARLLSEMRRPNLQLKPDMITYATVIQGYGRINQPQKGEELLRQMVGENIRPDRQLFMSLRGAYIRLGMEAEAKRISSEMRSWRL